MTTSARPRKIRRARQIALGLATFDGAFAIATDLVASRRGPRSRRVFLLTVAALNALAARISHEAANQMS